MFFICMLCPSVISVAVINGLLREKVSYLKYFERYCISIVVVNTVLFAINQYILKYPQSTVKLIETDNGVVAKCLIIASIVAIGWGAIFSMCRKNISISLHIEDNADVEATVSKVGEDSGKIEK